jgi:hypothetical protein
MHEKMFVICSMISGDPTTVIIIKLSRRWTVSTTIPASRVWYSLQGSSFLIVSFSLYSIIIFGSMSLFILSTWKILSF